MANIEFEWDFDEVMQEIEKMGKDVKKVEGNATRKAAEVVKNAVEKNLPRSDIAKSGYVHMADDVKISGLKEDKETGDSIREVKGSRKTHYKWKWLEFGTSKMKGNQFITKSKLETESEVADIINDEIKKELDL